MGKKRDRSHIVKRILKISMMIFLFYCGVSILNYLYVDGDAWYRIFWHHFYEDDGGIDCVIIGASHVYCDINPELLGSINNQYNFNLATPEQRLNSSYYLLKEAGKNNELTHVYLELYYKCLTKDNFNDDIDPIHDEVDYNRSWQNTDFMRCSANKLAYMFSIGSWEDYTDIFLPISRYRLNLNDWNYVGQVVNNKKGQFYRTYSYRWDFEDGNGYDEMLGQGYFLTTRKLVDDQRLFEQPRILDENPIGETSEEYLRKIISYCQKRDIAITLFVSPVDQLLLISAEKYDYYLKQVREIAEEYDLDFYDFNLTKEEYLPIWENKYFRDAGHLNYEGASLFTPFFYDVVSGNYVDNEKYFYSSYEEKLESLEPAIYGLYYHNSVITEENPEQIKTFYIASNRETGMEYLIRVIPDEGEEFIVQDFHTNKMFARPAEEHGICIIEARVEGDTESVQTLRINY